MTYGRAEAQSPEGSNRHEPENAEGPSEDMRKEFPNISLGTVYRNLSLLADLGQIRKITTGTGAEHYDGDIHPHNHFICKCCGKVTDMNDFIDNSKIRDLASGQFDGRIDECNIQFYGVCGECLKKEEGPAATS